MEHIIPIESLPLPGEGLPKVGEITSISATKIFHVEQVELAFQNGAKRSFERLKRWSPGVVMIIPLHQETLLLIREYGTGIDEYALSFPKGRIEQNEDVLEAANRELQEEVGFKANKLTHLRLMTNTPNYSATQMHLVLAEELLPSRLPADEPEPFLVASCALSNVAALLERPDFNEARAIAALYLLERHLKKAHDTTIS